MVKAHLIISILTFVVAFRSARVRADEPLLVESSSTAPSSPVSVRDFPRVIAPLKFDNELPGTSGLRFVTIPDGVFSSTTLSLDPIPLQFEDLQNLSAPSEDVAIANWHRQLSCAENVKAWPVDGRNAPTKHKGRENSKVDLRLIAPALTANQLTKQRAPQVPTITLQVDRAPNVLKTVMAYRIKVVPNNRPLSVPGLIEFRR